MMSVTRSRAARFSAVAIFGLAAGFALSGAAVAQKAYDTGASDTRIKIGNIMPYSGPASAYAVIGRTESAYFQMINEQGGINGRKIRFISYDDGYSPPKAVEQIRRLVEDDEVLAVFNTLGTPSNVAMQRYLNTRNVPQLFIATGASRWNDPQQFPWTMGWQPTYQQESHIYAKWLLKEKPGARVGILYQNDDFGRDYLKGLRDGLGAKAASMIVSEESYEVFEPTVEGHLAKIKSANPDVLVIFATPKFAAQTINKAAELNWKPIRILANVSASIRSVIKPAGIENAQGIFSTTYYKEATDPQWADDEGMKKFNAFIDTYMPGQNKTDANIVYGYGVAQTLVKVLTMCGDDLTRANLMKQAASLKNFVPDTLLPGVSINTSATDFAPISQLQMMRFTGENWEVFGDVISANLTN